MTMDERRAKGLLWLDTGESLKGQAKARGLCQEFNASKATEIDKRKGLLQKIFGFCDNSTWIEPPLTVAMGKTVKIGKGSVIGAGTVVTKDIPAMSLAVGVPAKVLRPITDADKVEY